MRSVRPGTGQLQLKLVAMLQLRKVAKSFHRRPVLKDISLSLSEGERLFLVGLNGSGKTTLLKIMAGVMRPEQGSGQLDDLPLFTPDGSWRRSVAYLGHHAGLYPSFSARDNLKLVQKLRRLPWDEQRFMELLDRYGLQGRESEPVQVYSEGMLRRLGLVRLSLTHWQVALLDEPGSALDVDGTALLSQAMTDWQREGRSLLFTSHDVAWGAEMADRSLLLAAGVIASELTQPDETAIRAALAGAGPAGVG